ncbi:MAG: beta-ketoacyl-ACP synthase [Cyanophyceae cyanobacterium]
MGPEAVVVTGIALATALGDREATWGQLLRGESGLVRAQPFGELPPLPLGLLDPLGPVDLLPLTRRLGAEVLEDGGLRAPLGDRWGVVVGSSRSFQGDLERWRCEGAKGGGSSKPWPLVWPGSVAAAIAAGGGASGPAIAPMAACGTGLVAIAQGAELVRSGHCDGVIAGAIDAPITPLTIAGFLKMGALSPSGLRPFDRDRDGFALGEGGALLLLEARGAAIARGARIYGTILGSGSTVDAEHSVAPGQDLRAAEGAMAWAIARSEAILGPTAIGYVHAHGTGTTLNDAREAQLIQTRWPKGIPVSSTKGATGHTLGASGAIGAALTLLALHRHVLPPCIGLRQPAFPDLDLINTARPGAIAAALTLAFGFGGVNSALVMAAELP